MVIKSNNNREIFKFFELFCVCIGILEEICCNFLNGGFEINEAGFGKQNLCSTFLNLIVTKSKYH